MAAIKDMNKAQSGATITLTKLRKEQAAKEAKEAVKNAKPRATFSLFGLGMGREEGLPPASAPARAIRGAAP